MQQLSTVHAEAACGRGGSSSSSSVGPCRVAASEANGETGQSGVARCDLESQPAMQSAIAARTQAGMAGWQPPADMDGAAHNGRATQKNYATWDNGRRRQASQPPSHVANSYSNDEHNTVQGRASGPVVVDAMSTHALRTTGASPRTESIPKHRTPLALSVPAAAAAAASGADPQAQGR
ncbi:hypothetical protein ACCO45_002442 [Purpureocillium lilacinum]